ncbi:hypothetical protein Ancab_006703 [Ancistrocladus abbreviatus]
MIFVGGLPCESNSAQGSDDLAALLEHPALVSAALSFQAVPEKKFSSSDVADFDGLGQRKHVYLFQREYATVDPSLVDLIGTDEATTCVGLIIRNRESGMTSVAHMDSPEVVDAGLSQMLSGVVDPKYEAELDVHLIGGFEEHMDNNTGHSLPLCAKIVEALRKSTEKFHIQTLFVLGDNTRTDAEGNAYPIFSGFLVETLTGSVIPASFDKITRCPDELVRRIRVSASFEDPCWRGKLLETYNTQTDQFIIAPCYWNLRFVHVAYALRKYADSEILHICSTSPSAEAPDFVENQRRQWDYLIGHPDWKETFKMGKPRIFERSSSGDWIMVE